MYLTGPIVRLAPNMLSFSDATLSPRVYHSAADKPAFYGSWMFGNTASMFQSLSHQDHHAKRRLVAPCVRMPVRLRSLGIILTSYIRAVLDVLHEDSTRNKNQRTN